MLQTSLVCASMHVTSASRLHSIQVCDRCSTQSNAVNCQTWTECLGCYLPHRPQVSKDRYSLSASLRYHVVKCRQHVPKCAACEMRTLNANTTQHNTTSSVVVVVSWADGAGPARPGPARVRQHCTQTDRHTDRQTSSDIQRSTTRPARRTLPLCSPAAVC